MKLNFSKKSKPLQDLSHTEEFWRKELKDFTFPTPLAVDRQTRYFPDQEIRREKEAKRLSKEMTSALRSLAQQHQLSLEVVIPSQGSILTSPSSGESNAGAVISDALVESGVCAYGRSFGAVQAETVMRSIVTAMYSLFILIRYINALVVVL